MARDSQRSKCYKWDGLMARTYPQLGATKVWPDPDGVSPSRDQNADARFLIRYVLSDYGIDPSRVKVLFSKRNGGACANAWMLNFTPGHVSREFIYHELCHTIIMSQPWQVDLPEPVTVPRKYIGSSCWVEEHVITRRNNPIVMGAAHGPIFVRLLAEVISFYEQIPVEDLLKLAKLCGLRYAKASEVPQRVAEELVKLDPKYYGKEVAALVVGMRRKQVPTGMSKHVVMVKWPSGSVGRHEETQLTKVNPK